MNEPERALGIEARRGPRTYCHQGVARFQHAEHFVDHSSPYATRLHVDRCAEHAGEQHAAQEVSSEQVRTLREIRVMDREDFGLLNHDAYVAVRLQRAQDDIVERRAETAQQAFRSRSRLKVRQRAWLSIPCCSCWPC